MRKRAVHSGQLERWLGAEALNSVSQAMTSWYGPPIALHGVPGAVYAAKGGDFIGTLRAGWEATKLDKAWDLLKRLHRGLRKVSHPNHATLYAGFSGLSDLIAEASAGKRYEFQFQKAGATGVVAVTSSLWRLGAQPPAGASPAAAAAGTAFTSASTGAFPYTNPTGGDTLHFVSGFPLASVAGNTLLLYDLIFGVAKTMNSTANEAVTGVPTRYQNATGGTVDSAEGNFLAVHVGGTALAATAHNWDTCLYTDQSGNASSALPTITGNASAIVDRLDHPAGQWFAPLATGDTGVKALTQMHCSAAVATGVIWFMMGHPIAWMPCPIANMICTADGINTAFNLVRIFDSACLTFLEVCKPATTATNYTGTFTAVAG